MLPFTWSGGGGPPGNRYALSAYPVLLFLMPPMASVGPGLLAWLVGALFTARMLVNPFAAAKFTWELYERGMPRRLPVELPMSQDLPVALAQPMRSPIPYGDPGLRLSFLDQNAWPPEPPGMWISGAGRAEIILRAERPVRHLVVEAESPIRTTVTVSLGGDEVTHRARAAKSGDVHGAGRLTSPWPLRRQRLSDDDALQRRLRAAPRRWIAGLPEPRRAAAVPGSAEMIGELAELEGWTAQADLSGPPYALALRLDQSFSETPSPS